LVFQTLVPFERQILDICNLWYAFTDSDFPFGIFKLFLHIWDKMTKWPFYVIKDSRLFWFQAYGPSLTPTPLIQWPKEKGQTTIYKTMRIKLKIK
jgi:hypothetical protein